MAPGPGSGMAVRAAGERTFCRTREPAGVLEMLAWPPEVQKAARAAEPVMPETDGNRTRTWSGNFSSPPFKVDHIF